jgi:hypothetical protein
MWACLLFGAGAALMTGREFVGFILMIIGVMLPVTKKMKVPKKTDDSPT